jgi:hypothetical protein
MRPARERGIVLSHQQRENFGDWSRRVPVRRIPPPRVPQPNHREPAVEDAARRRAIIPGHGPLAKRADLESYRAMLTDSLAVVGKALAEGKSAKDIVAAKPLAKYDKWAWPFISTDKWVETVAAELATERK